MHKSYETRTDSQLVSFAAQVKQDSRVSKEHKLCVEDTVKLSTSAGRAGDTVIYVSIRQVGF